MAYGFSKADIIGNLTDTIDLRKTNSGKTVASFTLAVNETKETVSYLDCTAWEKSAEILAKNTRKGDQLFISGDLTQSRYEIKGEKRSRVVIIVREFRFLYKKANSTDVAPEEIDDSPADLSAIPF